MIKNNSDFLFMFDATNTNPNGDPDQENRPRMDYETKTMLVSDVRRKRDVRDFLSNKGMPIFVNTLNDTKVTMDRMFEEVMKKYGLTKNSPKEVIVDTILNNMIDMRIFGSAMAVAGMTKTFTGPVQISWGYSLHPVDIIKSSSIVTIMNDDSSTFGKMYKAHYALVAHSGTVNKFAAAKTNMSDEDMDVFRKALVQSMMNNQTHSKQGQQPLLYIEVIYNENFDGYLGDMRRFIDVKLKKDSAIREIDDINVDFSRLCSEIEIMKNAGYIKEVKIWKNSLADKFVNLPEGNTIDLLEPLK